MSLKDIIKNIILNNIYIISTSLLSYFFLFMNIYSYV